MEVEIEAERAEVDLAKAEHDLYRVWRELAAMVGDPDLPMTPLAGNLETDLPALDEARVREVVLRESPELRIARARVEHAKASLARARADRVPNFFVRAGGGYNARRFAPGKDVGAEFFLEIGVPLPLFMITFENGWTVYFPGSSAATQDMALWGAAYKPDAMIFLMGPPGSPGTSAWR